MSELFNFQNWFKKVECTIYGRLEMVSIAVVNLLWKPAGGLIRFVLAVTESGPIVLMCSDLDQNAVAALELYCARTRIETMFDMLKKVMGVFRYRFWTQDLPRHSRKPVTNKLLKKSKNVAQMHKVNRCFAAYERFVMTGAIALGLLQLVALKFERYIWEAYDDFLRTKSRSLPSERTVKVVMANLIVRNFFSSAAGTVMHEIQAYCFKGKKSDDLRCQRANSTHEMERTCTET